MALAIVIIAAVLVGLLFAYLLRAPSTPSAPAPAGAASAAPSVRRVLTIKGTSPFEGAVGFVKSFGLSPDLVQDIRIFKPDATMEGPDLPQDVRDCIATAYAKGTCRGIEVPSIVVHGRKLEKGEALYFALVGSGANCNVFTFVDRAHDTVAAQPIAS